MGRIAKFDQLPEEVREFVYEMYHKGMTIEKVTEWLNEKGHELSYPTVGRNKKSWKEALEEQVIVQRFAEAAVKELAHEPESKVARLTTNLIQSALFRVMANVRDVEDTDPETAVKLLGQIARAHRDLSTAAKNDITTTITKNDYSDDIAAATSEENTDVQGIQVTFLGKENKEEIEPGKGENNEQAEKNA